MILLISMLQISGVAAAILLPLVLVAAVRAYRTIPLAEYKPWYNPVTYNNPMSATANRRHPVQFRLYMHHDDKMERAFDMLLPGKIKLGLLFHYFLHEHNSTNVPATAIEAMESKGAFGWEFYEEIMGGLSNRWLSPELSLQENKVRANAIIHIRRRVPVAAHA